jgi:hypothetical protein
MKVWLKNPSEPTGPRAANRIPEFGLSSGGSSEPGPAANVELVLPDFVQPLRVPVSKPQLTMKFPTIASQILGVAAAGPGKPAKPTAADIRSEKPEILLATENRGDLRLRNIIITTPGAAVTGIC